MFFRHGRAVDAGQNDFTPFNLQVNPTTSPPNISVSRAWAAASFFGPLLGEIIPTGMLSTVAVQPHTVHELEALCLAMSSAFSRFVYPQSSTQRLCDKKNIFFRVLVACLEIKTSERRSSNARPARPKLEKVLSADQFAATAKSRSAPVCEHLRVTSIAWHAGLVSSNCGNCSFDTDIHTRTLGSIRIAISTNEEISESTVKL